MIYNLLLIILSLSGPLIYGTDNKNNLEFPLIVNDDDNNNLEFPLIVNDHNNNLSDSQNSIYPNKQNGLSKHIFFLKERKDKLNKLIRDSSNRLISHSQFYDRIYDLFEQGLPLSRREDPYGNTILCGALNRIYPDSSIVFNVLDVLSRHILSLSAYCDIEHKKNKKPVFCFLLICKDYQKKMKQIVPRPIKMKIIDEAIRSNAIMASLKEFSHRVSLKKDLNAWTYSRSPVENLLAKKNEKEICNIFEQKYNGYIAIAKDYAYLRRFDFINLYIDYERDDYKRIKNEYSGNHDYLFQSVEKLAEKNDLLNPKNWYNSYSISVKKINEHTNRLCLRDEQKTENTVPNKKSGCIIM